MTTAAATPIDTPTPADAAHVLGLIGGYQVSQAVYAAARLGIADLIADGVVTTTALAERTGSDPDRLYRLLRSLASFGLFSRTADSWQLTPAGTLLRDDPASLHGMAIMWNEEHYVAFGSLHEALDGGGPAFERRYGVDWWTYLSQHPDSAEKFQAGMGSIGKKVHAAAIASADLTGATRLVDVGGGAGGLTAGLLERHPDLQATVFDLPHVLGSADELLTSAGVRDRVALEGGDFFDRVPPGGDAYLLSMILHDWDDAQAHTILSNIRAGIAPSGRLLIIDAVLPDDDSPHFGKLLDLTMMAMLGGRERSRAEFTALLDRAGFSLDQVIDTGAPTSLIVATPRT